MKSKSNPAKLRVSEERPSCGVCHQEMTSYNSKRHPELFLCDMCAPGYSESEHHSKEWLISQSVSAFRKRADTWESDQGELGEIVASELRVVIDCFEEIMVKAKTNHVLQLENELRYCLMLIETNLDVQSDLRVEYAKSLLTRRV